MTSDQTPGQSSAVQLRAEARALLEYLADVKDSADRRQLARRAYELVRQAEELQMPAGEAANAQGNASPARKSQRRGRESVAA